MRTLAAISLLLLMAALESSADETLVPTSAVANGGSTWALSDSCAIQFSVGQPCPGVVVGQNTEAHSGFWCAGWAEEAPEGYIGVPWSWIAVPFYPVFPDPAGVLGYDCSGGLWRWDKYAKTAQVYQPPPHDWDIEAAESYLAYVESVPDPVCHCGFIPLRPYEFKMGRMGWVWLSMPGVHELGYPDFMSAVTVVYPSDETGEVRTAAADRLSGEPWVAWGWPFWDTALQTARTLTPYAPFGENVCRPWIGYRAWANVGTAMDEDDPDQVTLIWP